MISKEKVVQALINAMNFESEYVWKVKDQKKITDKDEDKK